MVPTSLEARENLGNPSKHGITTKSMKLYYRRISSGCTTPHMGHITEAFGSAVFALHARFDRHCFKRKPPTMKAQPLFSAEVESILNSRPITTVSSDSQDPEPLTPSHLLLLQSEPQCPLGFSKRRILCRDACRDAFRHFLETMVQRISALTPEQTEMDFAPHKIWPLEILSLSAQKIHPATRGLLVGLLKFSPTN